MAYGRRQAPTATPYHSCLNDRVVNAKEFSDPVLHETKVSILLRGFAEDIPIYARDFGILYMNLSYWEHTSWPGNIDHLVIGAGLTGLQVAIALKERFPKHSVVVTERAPWSQGASLKNAGFACFANCGELIDDLMHSSEDEVIELAGKRYQGLMELRTKYGENNIGYSEQGSHEFFDGSNRDQLTQCLDALGKINTLMYEATGEDQVFQYRSNSPLSSFEGVIANRLEGQLDTGLLYRSIYDYALACGVKIFGGMEYVTHEKGKAIFKGLELSTANIYLCTNGFAQGIEDVVPARGQVLCTKVVKGLKYRGLGMYDRGYYYWRNVHGRILLGGARNMDVEGEQTTQFGENNKVMFELERFLYEKLVDRDVDIEYKWSGIMGMGTTQKKKPLIKALEPGVFIAARLGGMGVALSSVVAKELVALVD